MPCVAIFVHRLGVPGPWLFGVKSVLGHFNLRYDAAPCGLIAVEIQACVPRGELKGIR